MVERKQEEKGPDGLSTQERQILTTGEELEASGIDWWSAKQCIDAMVEKRFTRGLLRSNLYIKITNMYTEGLLDRRNGLPENPEAVGLFYQVSKEGHGLNAQNPLDVGVPVLIFNPLPQFG